VNIDKHTSWEIFDPSFALISTSHDHTNHLTRLLLWISMMGNNSKVGWLPKYRSIAVRARTFWLEFCFCPNLNHFYPFFAQISPKSKQICPNQINFAPQKNLLGMRLHPQLLRHRIERTREVKIEFDWSRGGILERFVFEKRHHIALRSWGGIKVCLYRTRPRLGGVGLNKTN